MSVNTSKEASFLERQFKLSVHKTNDEKDMVKWKENWTNKKWGSVIQNWLPQLFSLSLGKSFEKP